MNVKEIVLLLIHLILANHKLAQMVLLILLILFKRQKTFLLDL